MQGGARSPGTKTLKSWPGAACADSERTFYDMRRLFLAADLPEAHLVLQLLKHAGIEARVFDETAQGGLGEISFIHA